MISFSIDLDLRGSTAEVILSQLSRKCSVFCWLSVKFQSMTHVPVHFAVKIYHLLDVTWFVSHQLKF